MIESYVVVSYLRGQYIDKGLAPKFNDIKARAEYRINGCISPRMPCQTFYQPVCKNFLK